MEIDGPLSVRDIKGKFEKLVPSEPLRSPAFQRRRRTPFSTVDPSPNDNNSEDASKGFNFLTSRHNYDCTEKAWPNTTNNNNLSPAYLDKGNHLSDQEVDVDIRYRSHSVGSLLGIGTNHRTLPNFNYETSLSRNQSFNEANRKEKVKRNDETPYPNYISNDYNNFSSFSEKQKLVESIVMNIKNSRNQNKENGITQTKYKNCATKENNITSKLEKDIKNALERGVRILSTKNTKDKLFANDRQVVDTDWAYKPKSEETTNDFKTPSSNQRRSFSKINAFLGEYVYPSQEKKRTAMAENMNESVDEDKDDLHKEWRAKKTAMRPNKFGTNQFCSDRANNIDVSTIYDSTSQIAQPEMISSPLRPPRKRSPKKKGKAPSPPFTSDQNGANESIPNTAEIISSVTDKTEEQNISQHSLEINASAEYEIYATVGNKPIGIKDGDEFHSNEKVQEISVTGNDEMLRRRTMSEASPPKKPPRTFAHDIYQCYKDNKEFTELSTKAGEVSKTLTNEEIESLYTKPLKRNKNKEGLPDLPHSEIETKVLPPKPAIAPKPTDIIERANKRYSVVEPLSSSSSKEFADRRPSVKRNSSFRFSFRKSKKSSVSHPSRPVAAKTDSPVGRKFRQVTRQWQHKRSDNERHVKFRPRSINNEGGYKGDEDERIYAVPTNVRHVSKQQPELHYMCSPLFADDRVKTPLHTSQREKSPEPDQTSDSEDSTNAKGDSQRHFQRNVRGKLGLMDGLKEEWRQSYRFVQKRLKKGLPPSARKL